MKSLKVLIVMLRACFILLLVAVSTQVFGQMSFDAPVITSLQIWGNQAVPGGSLKALMVTRASPWYDFLLKVQAHRFDAVTLGADLERLRAYYRDLGYFEAVVDSTVERSREDEVSLYIRIGFVGFCCLDAPEFWRWCAATEVFWTDFWSESRGCDWVTRIVFFSQS